MHHCGGRTAARAWWELACLALALFYAAALPFRAAFSEATSGNSGGVDGLELVAHAAVDAFFLVDTALRSADELVFCNWGFP